MPMFGNARRRIFRGADKGVGGTGPGASKKKTEFVNARRGFHDTHKATVIFEAKTPAGEIRKYMATHEMSAGKSTMLIFQVHPNGSLSEKPVARGNGNALAKLLIANENIIEAIPEESVLKKYVEHSKRLENKVVRGMEREIIETPFGVFAIGHGHVFKRMGKGFEGAYDNELELASIILERMHEAKK